MEAIPRAVNYIMDNDLYDQNHRRIQVTSQVQHIYSKFESIRNSCLSKNGTLIGSIPHRNNCAVIAICFQETAELEFGESLITIVMGESSGYF
jgi:hypothetical protein